MTYILRFEADIVEKGTRNIVGDPVITQWTEICDSYEDAAKILDERAEIYRTGLAREGVKEVIKSTRTIIKV